MGYDKWQKELIESKILGLSGLALREYMFIRHQQSPVNSIKY